MSFLDTEIQEVEAAIQPLAFRLKLLREQKREVDSRNFIRVNQITRDQVELSSGEGKPFFGTAWVFGEWLKSQPTVKPWAEWNGRIYHSVDLMNGRMPDMPGEVDHLP